MKTLLGMRSLIEYLQVTGLTEVAREEIKHLAVVNGNADLNDSTLSAPMEMSTPYPYSLGGR